MGPALIAPTKPDRNVAEEVLHAIKWAVSRWYVPVAKLTAGCNAADAMPILAVKSPSDTSCEDVVDASSCAMSRDIIPTVLITDRFGVISGCY